MCSLHVISDAFEGQSKIKRHQMVYGILKEELAAEVHALSMKLQTPSEVA